MKRLLIITLVLTVLLIASCGPSTAPVNDRTVPFIGGNAGVNVGLINGVPPAAVYDNGRMDFGIGVVLENVGEADFGPGTDNPFARVAIEGLLPNAFGVTPADLVQNLDRELLGSHKNFDGTILPGQIHNLVFEPLNYQEPLQGNSFYNFVVNACYDYENFATVPLCFKNDVIETVQDAQICTLTGEKSPMNSGGPLHVTSLVENPLGPYKVMVNFIVEHVGTGDFYGRTADETCDPSVTNTNKYHVHVDVKSENPSTTIECSTLGGSGEGDITLFQGAPTTVTCTLTGDPAAASRIYSELLSINLEYRYGENVMQTIIVQAVGDA